MVGIPSSNSTSTLKIHVHTLSSQLLSWGVTIGVVGLSLAYVLIPEVNSAGDRLLHDEGIHIATPEVKVMGRVVVPGKTIYRWKPPLAGHDVVGGSGGQTGLDHTEIEAGMVIAGFEVTSGFGPRPSPCPGCSSNHGGVDLATPVGTPLKAFLNGTKVTCWWDSGGGGQVADIQIGPEFYQALHLDTCRNGTYGTGETFARTGSTGNGTGPHLDWRQEVGGQKVKPRAGVLEAVLTGKPPEGFNPAPYLDGSSSGDSQGLGDFVGKWEGFRECPYMDPVGIPTIGYGTTFYPDGRAVSMGDSCISEEQARQYKEQDLGKFKAMVQESVTAPMTEAQENAFTSFLYNVGPAGKESSAIQKFNAGDVWGAAEALKLWNKGEVNGQMQVLPGLVDRRNEEAAKLLEDLKK